MEMRLRPGSGGLSTSYERWAPVMILVARPPVLGMPVCQRLHTAERPSLHGPNPLAPHHHQHPPPAHLLLLGVLCVRVPLGALAGLRLERVQVGGKAGGGRGRGQGEGAGGGGRGRGQEVGSRAWGGIRGCAASVATLNEKGQACQAARAVRAGTLFMNVYTGPVCNYACAR